MGIQSAFRPYWTSVVFVTTCLIYITTVSSAAEGNSEVVSTTPAPSLNLPTAVQLEEFIKQAESNETLSDDAKTQIITAYRRAIELSKATKDAQRQAESFAKRRQSVPKDTEAVKADLEKLQNGQFTFEWQTATDTDPSQKLQAAETELQQATVKRDTINDESKRRVQRRGVFAELIAEATKRSQKATADATTPPGAEAGEIELARYRLALFERSAAEAEIASLRAEQAYYDAGGDLLRLQQDLATQFAEKIEKAVLQLRTKVAQSRESGARRALRVANELANELPESLKPISDEHIRLAQEWVDLSTKITETEAKLQAVKNARETLQKAYDQLKSSTAPGGSEYLANALMRKHRQRFQDAALQTRDLASIQENLKNAQNKQLLTAELRTPLLDTKAAATAAIEENNADASFIPIVQESFKAQSAILGDLSGDYERYMGRLVGLEVELRALLSLAEEANTWMDQRFLWTQSTTPIHRMSFPQNIGSQVSLLKTITVNIGQDLRAHPVGYILGIAIIVGLVILRAKLFRIVTQYDPRAASVADDRFRNTLLSIGAVAAMALVIPVAFFLASQAVLQQSTAAPIDAFAFMSALADALADVAWIAYLLIFIRLLAKTDVGTRHFGWNATRMAALNAACRSLLVFVTPLIFIVSFEERLANDDWRNSIGRLAFIAIAIIIMRIAYRLASACKPKQDKSTATTTFFRVIAILIPLTLAILSLAGYHYTAIHMAIKLGITIIAITAVIITLAAARRWANLTQRRAAFAGSDDADTAVDPSTTPLGHGLEVSQQTRRVLKSLGGLAIIILIWQIWSDTIPALHVLETIKLWSYDSLTADGIAKEVVTLVDAIAAIIIFTMTILLTKNVPGLLETMILSRTRIAASTQFALTTIVRYSLAIVGIVLSFGAIGIGWSKVQWLIAAATVGLGFGLQEIFANFVSGIILLFERPIRIGDTISVGDNNGTVTQMRIRATTITDWDRKEVVIPNKEFITGQVINWSLSDKLLRIVLKVGISYSDDPIKAKQIILEVAKKEPKILNDPKPHAWFLGFGDNALEIELRAFTQSIDDWIAAKDALHTDIFAAFREAGIEIAFPQRDIHIKSLPPGIKIGDQ